ncbi:Nucleolar protein 58 [Boothiomyces macroporosus]|uniref:Nucleolar protein 58 n=1 Tax=Boothiomyces macroporosus TaxID=261099 RepID=A0AAD5UEJ3_9FUNG|nr:Nucleolar protein 58 [Boothiomyces macroporosus]
MLILYETSAGYALFKLLDDGSLEKPDDIHKHFATAEKANKAVKLKAFAKFENTTEALSAVTALVEGKISKNLKSFLTTEFTDKDLKDTLAVADAKLGSAIAKKLGIKVVSDQAVNEVFRGIRGQLSNLIAGLAESDMNAMVLGLSHSLSRYKLKFSPDKVDTMIIQAIALLDDLDKELNTYSMRVKEWYGWHFPEIAKLIVDNVAFAKTIKAMGFRTNASTTDFSDILPEELETALKEAAEVSMGTEISEEDIENITYLCDQIISISEYRAQLYDYLKNRMAAIAPNLTCLVGELVGARLISHAGSLMNLSKQPASTVQILGAEKALFRALKSKHDTPKYGLIYHASLVGQAGPKIKGKIARTLATKAALAIRCDALGDAETPEVGVELRTKIENRLRQLEGKAVQKSNTSKSKKEVSKVEYSM